MPHNRFSRFTRAFCATLGVVSTLAGASLTAVADPAAQAVAGKANVELSETTVAELLLEPRQPVSTETLRSIVDTRKLALPLRDANIIIHKAQRRLELYSGSTLVKSYRVALGENPVGHKENRGDSRTPEGHFYICTRNAKDSAFHIFLGLSYPGLPDAERAATTKQITPREYMLIREKLASRAAPLWETPLGGWIGIHGGTDAKFARKKMKERSSPDWTAGCIALTDRQIAEIHAATTLGTPVEIRP